MALTAAYLITTKNLNSFFDSLITAKAPEVFTLKFIQNLEFKSTNDRLYIGVLKGLGFLDGNGAPTDRYFKFLDLSQSKKVLAEAIKDAYGDLFDVNTRANEMSYDEVKNKFRTLTQGQYSDKVLSLMARTFVDLVAYASWDGSILIKEETEIKNPISKPTNTVNENAEVSEIEIEDVREKNIKTQLHYNIQIHLPDTRDQAVYDAIFQSLKRHLF